MKSPTSSARRHSSGQLTSAPLHVVVVDDEPDVCEMMRHVLEREGYAVSIGTTARRALEIIATSGCDLVLADIAMPETDGITLCQELSGIHPGLPMMLVTGRADMSTLTKALRVGVRDFLPKPLDMTALLSSVARIIGHPADALSSKAVPEQALGLKSDLELASLLGESGGMRELRKLIIDLADSAASVVIQGETGTGKELIARALHATSRLSDGPFVAVNCAAMPAGLLESELFGHARGAFTDAKTATRGLLVQANDGTLLLDEIAELPLALQPKLLRALQERTVRPVGEHREIAFNCRLIAAASQNLELEVKAKRFREDLYYRLEVVRIVVPPLRARGEDVLLLAQHFLTRFSGGSRGPVTLSEAAKARLLAYNWPGNVRELENCMQRALALAPQDELAVADLPERIQLFEPDGVAPTPLADAAGIESGASLFDAERSHVLRTVQRLDGNKTRAAALLGIDRRTLYRRLRLYAAGNTS
ncbi:MAG TPA: sigma-54 dependent transcriptional regulator [Polyangiaceae bacterium]|nr:sigma-54 dependent transcriptional regulator [Polyangiaceae bacterium]